MMRQLLDVVNHAKQIPLRVHLWLGTQREPVQPSIVPQVSEDGFDDGDPPTVELAALLAVDRLLHALGVFQRRILILLEERHLSDLGALGVAQD